MLNKFNVHIIIKLFLELYEQLNQHEEEKKELLIGTK